MRSILRIGSLCLLAILAAGCTGSPELTEAQAREVVVAAEAAASRNDVKAASAFLSDDCTINSVSRNADGTEKIKTQSKAEYVAAEIESQARLPGSRYESQAPTIAMDASGSKATAKYVATQSFDQDGKAIVARADQLATVELRNGNPIITSIRSTITRVTIDGHDAL